MAKLVNGLHKALRKQPNTAGTLSIPCCESPSTIPQNISPLKLICNVQQVNMSNMLGCSRTPSGFQRMPSKSSRFNGLAHVELLLSSGDSQARFTSTGIAWAPCHFPNVNDCFHCQMLPLGSELLRTTSDDKLTQAAVAS